MVHVGYTGRRDAPTVLRGLSSLLGRGACQPIVSWLNPRAGWNGRFAGKQIRCDEEKNTPAKGDKERGSGQETCPILDPAMPACERGTVGQYDEHFSASHGGQAIGRLGAGERANGRGRMGAGDLVIFC